MERREKTMAETARPKLLTLEEWAAAVYGDRPPSLVTLRRWARECRIYPVPEKHGRCYYVRADARYSDPRTPVATKKSASGGTRLRLVDRIRRA
jgi:hypothetical protein